MSRLARLRMVFAFCPVMMALTSGCQREVPNPAKVEPTTAAASIASTPEQVHLETPFVLESDFALLTRDDFDAFAAEPETWMVTADGINCSGKPRGYLYSKQTYQNFTWRLDYRFPRSEKLKDDTKFKGNTGFLVYVTGEHKLWPICLEVQGKFIQMAAIKENGGAEPVTVEDDEIVRAKVRKPVGQWNSLQIVSKEGAIEVSLNGTPVSHSLPGTLTGGGIGIQAEDHPFEVRRMRIRAD